MPCNGGRPFVATFFHGNRSKVKGDEHAGTRFQPEASLSVSCVFAQSHFFTAFCIVSYDRIPHFYSAFYVYKYATGIISALSIANRILTEGEPAVKDYFAFLSSGGSNDPVSLLKIAGVDLTNKETFESAMKVFEDTLTEFCSIEV